MELAAIAAESHAALAAAAALPPADDAPADPLAADTGGRGRRGEAGVLMHNMFLQQCTREEAVEAIGPSPCRRRRTALCATAFCGCGRVRS